MTPIAPHMSAFLRERLPLQRGASDHTCDSYAYAFQLLFQFASEAVADHAVGARAGAARCPLIMEFLHYLETERHNSPRTRNARLVAIKSFMRFLEYRVLLCSNTVDVFSPSQPRKPIPAWCIISPSRRCKAC